MKITDYGLWVSCGSEFKKEIAYKDYIYGSSTLVFMSSKVILDGRHIPMFLSDRFIRLQLPMDICPPITGLSWSYNFSGYWEAFY